MKKTLVLLLALCLLLAGCSASDSRGPEAPLEEGEPGESAEAPVQPVPLDTLEAVLALANERHRAIEKPRPTLTDYIGGTDDDFAISDYTVGFDEEIVYSPEHPVSLEEAERDLEVLFRSLATTYGPYHYFGGDEAFGAAREAILADCRELAGAGELLAQDVTRAIAERMGFIRDSHFQINMQPLQETEIAYVYSGAAFDRTMDGRFVRRGGGVLESVDGRDDPGALLQPTLTPQGEVVYCPVVLTGMNDFTPPDDLVLRYADGSSETVAPDAWSSGAIPEVEEPVQLSWRDGIPVVYCGTMGHDEADDDKYGKAFLALAEELRDQPVVILDLRWNGGGDGALPLKWLRAWSGGEVTTNSVGLQYMSDEALRAIGSDSSNPYYTSYETMTGLMAMTPVSEEYMSVLDVPDVFVENDSILIVLAGKNSASSAEQFVDAAMNVENVLVIGQNTYGCLRSNAYTRLQLPGSGTVVQLGCNLMFFPEGHFDEYVGFAPDLWAMGDAAELALAMLARYAAD